MKKALIVANWKMNKNIEETLDYIKDLAPRVKNEKSDIVIAPPFTSLYSAKKELIHSNIKLAAQNSHSEDFGQYTGEISSLMLKSLGVDYVILGHSERRNYFHEDNFFINKKIKACLANGLKVILCVGEKKEEREKNITESVIKKQLLECLDGVKKDFITIAYEPIWAIGTGLTATSEEASSVHVFIRKVLNELYGDSSSIRIIYGGSVKPENAYGLMSANGIDGVLVGGASLKVNDFEKIVKFGG